MEYFINSYLYIDKKLLNKDNLINNYRISNNLKSIAYNNSDELNELLYLHRFFVQGYEDEKFYILSSLLANLVND